MELSSNRGLTAPAWKAWHALHLEGRPRLLRAAPLYLVAAILGFFVGSPVVAEGSDPASVIPASVEFGEAIRLDPKFAQAYYDLGMTLSKMHKRDEAAREFKKALEVDPKFLAAQRALDDLRQGE
jgi:tetratricopeptide (TPR) repeat protein